ncbi:MAG: beta-ketoacyl-ACP reductase [Thalassobaculales bacterium]
MSAAPALAGTLALVTGSGRGIGRAIALALAAEGARLVVHDIDPAGVAATAGLLPDALPLVADVGEVAAMHAGIAAIEAAAGPIGILVNNAGIAADRRPLEALTPEFFERTMHVHLRGAIFTTQAVLPGMKRRGGGAIVNISSVQGLVGWTEGSAYNAAKGGLLALAKGWAKEFAPWGIRANAVAPGHVATDLVAAHDPPEVLARKAAGIPLGRYATPQEIAATVAFLCGPGAAFITGQVLSPNGGLVIT